VIEPSLTVTLDGHRGAYRPGEILSGQYQLDGAQSDQVEALEVSVLWYTQGKGDEDLAVHFFKRFSKDHRDQIDARHPGRFSTLLPNSPLSYEGMILKIRWCVRVRLFLIGGRELVDERPFQLGHIPAAKSVPP